MFGQRNRSTLAAIPVQELHPRRSLLTQNSHATRYCNACRGAVKQRNVGVVRIGIIVAGRTGCGRSGRRRRWTKEGRKEKSQPIRCCIVVGRTVANHKGVLRMGTDNFQLNVN